MNRWSLDQIMSPEFHYNFFSVTKKQIALFHPHYFVVKFFSLLQKTHTQSTFDIYLSTKYAGGGTSNDQTWLHHMLTPPQGTPNVVQEILIKTTNIPLTPKLVDNLLELIEQSVRSSLAVPMIMAGPRICWLATKIVMSYLDTFSAITSSQIRFLQID